MLARRRDQDPGALGACLVAAVTGSPRVAGRAGNRQPKQASQFEYPAAGLAERAGLVDVGDEAAQLPARMPDPVGASPAPAWSR